jgi:TonB-dependent SusC/RagA subfamily outer membrane receptor
MGKTKLTFLGFIMFTFSLNAQNKVITGSVSAAEDGKPLAGVSVTVDGTNIGTVSDYEGLFELQIPYPVQSLVFSFIGMKTARVSVESSTVNVLLHPDLIGLDEVVVVAYGALPKQHYTGSLSTVRAEQLERFQSSDFSRALQGLSAGLISAGGSGQPGESDAIRIRGYSTFGDASPLIVLDGFPFDGSLNSIPISDIESVTILKDAPATALYGSRAANGVIIVTTKQGTAGTSGLDVKMSFGLVNRAMPGYDKVSPSQYYELQWEGLRNLLTNPQTSVVEAGKKQVSSLFRSWEDTMPITLPIMNW